MKRFMGACYSVNLKVRIKDEKAATLRAKKFLATEKAFFHENTFRDEGVAVDTLEGMIQVVLAGWRCTQFEKMVREDGFVEYTNCFDASYGWEGVMMDFFDAMGPYMEDGSMIYIEPDSDYDKAEVKNGKVIWIH